MVTNISSKYPFRGAMESRIGGRAENQDSCGFSDTPSGLLVVICDGMGGGPAGKTASMIAIQTVIAVIKAAPAGDRKALFQDAISQANAAIRKYVEENPATRGMGTTIVALLVNEDSAVIAHVGDSRLYKMRDGMQLFRTKDHSMVGEMVRKGTLTEEQARLSAQSNVITRAIGTSPEVEAEIDEVAFEKGDTFALCTDGVWGAFPEPKLVKKFSLKRSEESVVEKLAMETDEVGKCKGGHHDNLTVAIVKTNIDSKKKDTMTRLAKRIILGLIALLVICVGIICYQHSAVAKNAALEDRIEELKSNITELNKQLGSKDLEIDQARSEVKAAQADTKAAQADAKIADANAKIAQSERDAANAKAEKAKEEAEKPKTQKDNADKPKSGSAKSGGSAQKNSQSAETTDCINKIIKLLEQLKSLTATKEGEMISQNKAVIKKIKTEIMSVQNKLKGEKKTSFEMLRSSIAAERKYRYDASAKKWVIIDGDKTDIDIIIKQLKAINK